MFRKSLYVAISAAFLVAACAPAATPEPTQAPEPAEPEATATTAPTATPAPKDIVGIAVEDGRFTTLVAALQAAELDQALKGEGPFTVFAPTDEAFAALPEGTVEALLGDIPALTEILLYHVVQGKVMAADVVELSQAETLQGQSVQVMVEDGKVMIDDAQVVLTDIEAANGVIHVIDAVILPVSE
jgi:uncharacterized surface protein with fasciclin (FAS1) repeats